MAGELTVDGDGSLGISDRVFGAALVPSLVRTG